MSACPECGNNAMKETIGRSSAVLVCENCGWSVARSWTEPINEDETVYEAILKPDNDATKIALATISKIADCNFIAAKSMLSNPEKPLVSGLAREIREALEELDRVGIEYTVTPEWPYQN